MPLSYRSDSAPVQDRHRTRSDEEARRLRRVRLTTVTAQTTEWFDFFIYTTAAALVFPAVFFSSSLSPLAATLSSFATVTVGFVARPIGGALFGHIGDKHGRRPALLLALATMAVGCLIIAVLPGFEQIGIAAPIALTACRILQGLAVGGQWGGGILLATENAPAHRKGLYGSLAQVGLPLGLIFASGALFLISTLLDESTFQSFGWRIPFVLGAVLILFPLVGQLKLEDTAEFKSSADDAGVVRKSPLVQVLREHPGRILKTAGTFIVVGATFYVLTTGMLAYGTQTIGFSRNTMLASLMIGAATMAVTIPLAAFLSDLVGRKPVFMTGAALTALWAFPMFALIETGNLALTTLAIAVGMGLNGAMYGPSAALFAEAFPVEIRYSGISLGYQLSNVLGGGFAPLIMTWLIAATGNTILLSVYIIGLSAITLASLAVLPIPRVPVRA
ncbi:MFS transporter [Rhodococcus koreensis]